MLTEEHERACQIGPIGQRPRAAEATVASALSVLFGFEATIDGAIVPTPTNVERILAFLAVRGRPQFRITAASMLWMDFPEERAAANFRTALWKARAVVPGWIDCRGRYISLASGVDLDLNRLIERSRRLIDERLALDEEDCDPRELAGDLLPDWDEDWVRFERERLRQLRIHALEALCKKLCAAGRVGEAIDAGLSAVEAEPLRESAQRVLIAAHLSEGNISEARRQYQDYREILWDGLGLEPSETLRSQVGLAPTR